jgi:SAM-dependent methyltransferase
MSDPIPASRRGRAFHLSSAYGQFPYFDAQLGHPSWRGKTVLDFGGNRGNLLRVPGCPIDESDYWCLDISEPAILEGRQRHPRAHWVFYDRFNFQYNPDGHVGLLIPALPQSFDVIVANSVFTHMPMPEMLDLVSQLRDRLRTSERLAFTFLDPHYDPAAHAAYRPPNELARNTSPQDREGAVGNNLRWRLRRRRDFSPQIDVDAMVERGKLALWCTLANDDLFLEQDGPAVPPADTCNLLYEVFYTPEYLRMLFPDAEILPPVSPSRQHCCILGRKDQA